MKGEAAFAIAANTKAVVSLASARGKPEQARFQLGAKTDHRGHKH